MLKPTRSEMEEWKSSPVTKWVVSQVEETREDLSVRLEGGDTLSNEPGLTAQLTARLVGEIAGLDWIINQEYMDKIEDMSNDS